MKDPSKNERENERENERYIFYEIHSDNISCELRMLLHKVRANEDG